MHRLVAGLSLLSLTGCLKPTLTDACTFGYYENCPDSTGAASTSATASPTTTDATTGPPEDTQAPGNLPPEFLSFTVGGSSNPPPVSAAGLVVLAAEVQDDVGVDRVEFFVEETLLGSDATPPYTFDWKLVDHTWDGVRKLSARAVDTDALATTSPQISLSVALPASGSIVWEQTLSEPDIDLDIPRLTQIASTRSLFVGATLDFDGSDIPLLCTTSRWKLWKLAADGGFAWEKPVLPQISGSPASCSNLTGLAASPEGKLLASAIAFGNDTYAGQLVAFDQDGGLLWRHESPGIEPLLAALAPAHTPEGGAYLITSPFLVGPNGLFKQELFVNRFDSAGLLSWSLPVSAKEGEFAFSDDLRSDARGNVHLAGRLNLGEDASTLVASISPAGTLLRRDTLILGDGTIAVTSESGKAIAVADDGVVFTSGESNSKAGAHAYVRRIGPGDAIKTVLSGSADGNTSLDLALSPGGTLVELAKESGALVLRARAADSLGELWTRSFASHEAGVLVTDAFGYIYVARADRDVSPSVVRVTALHP